MAFGEHILDPEQAKVEAVQSTFSFLSKLVRAFSAAGSSGDDKSCKPCAKRKAKLLAQVKGLDT